MGEDETFIPVHREAKDSFKAFCHSRGLTYTKGLQVLVESYTRKR